MNWLDIVIIILLVLAAISGFASGLIRVVFSLIGFILGVVLAGHFYVTLAEHLTFITNENAARIVAFIIILLAVIIIANVLGLIFSKIVSAIMLGWLDRLGGAAFSVILSAAFIAAALAIWIKYANGGDIISNSFLATLLVDRLPFLTSLLPSEFNSIHQFFQ